MLKKFRIRRRAGGFGGVPKRVEWAFAVVYPDINPIKKPLT